MPSPFPGMDPYLEDPGTWKDFHSAMIAQIAGQLRPQVKPKYYVSTSDRVYTLSERRLLDRAQAVSAEAEPGAGARSPAEPLHVLVFETEMRERCVNVVDASTMEAVTTIELIGPANKAHGEGYRMYQQKRHDALGSDANFIEIDLLGSGEQLVPEPSELRRPIARHRYVVSVNRARRRDVFELYPIALADALPCVRIPLRRSDADVLLDLQAAFNVVYDAGFEARVDYQRPPAAALAADEAAFVKQCLERRVPLTAPLA